MTIEEIGKKCTGCGLCTVVCPNGAIHLIENNEGFIYPRISGNNCVSCGLCYSKCPQLYLKNALCSIDTISKFYFAYSNSNSRAIGSSGGIFYALASHLILNNYIVFGARFDEQFNLSHFKATKTSELLPLTCSKYIQSNISSTFVEVKDALRSGQKVFFVGTPCQVAAIKAFCNDDNNLLTADLVCYGVASHAFFFDYLREKEKKFHSNVSSFVFRKKIIGNHDGYSIIKFSNGMKTKEIFFCSHFGVPFSRRLINRPSCFDCKYCSNERTGDITLGDYREPTNKEFQFSPWQLKKGVSLIRCNSPKGNDLFNKLLSKRKIVGKEIQKEYIEGNLVCQSENKIDTAIRDKAMKFYLDNGYESFVNKYCCLPKHSIRDMKMSYLKNILKYFLKK